MAIGCLAPAGDLLLEARCSNQDAGAVQVAVSAWPGPANLALAVVAALDNGIWEGLGRCNLDLGHAQKRLPGHT